MSPAITKILEGNDKNKIRELFAFNKDYEAKIIQKKFKIWAKYYLPQYFQSKDAPAHTEIDLRNIAVYTGKEQSFLDMGFRGLSKTTRTKLFLAFCIANDFEHHRKHIKILSKELKNAKQTVTDTYNILNSVRIKNLYPEIFAKSELKHEETMASFVTNTGVKLLADSVGTDQRGDVQEQTRPDLIIFDDFETKLSLMSAQITHKIWVNMDEAERGLAQGGGVIYLCNYVSERGNVHKLVQRVKNQINIPIANKVDGKWIPTWDRYTTEEVEKLEREADDFVGDYLGKPSASKDVYFDRASVDRQVAKEPLDEISGLKIFKKYNPSNRVGGGADVGGGVGLDSSAAVYLDFDTYPISVIATFRSNEIKPDAFAHELSRQGKRFGECYMGVEKNYGSTLDILKTIYPTDKIHKTRKDAIRITHLEPTEFGWDTNNATKPKMLAEFAKAIEDGIIELNDKDLIAEARSYSLGDLMDREVDPRLTTRHFDLLIAACIAFQMNPFIPKPITDEDYAFLNKMGDKPVNNKAR